MTLEIVSLPKCVMSYTRSTTSCMKLMAICFSIVRSREHTPFVGAIEGGWPADVHCKSDSLTLRHGTRTLASSPTLSLATKSGSFRPNCEYHLSLELEKGLRRRGRSSSIQSPNYFKGYGDLYDKLEAFDGELIFKDVLTEDVYDEYKDVKATLEVTVDKDVKVSLDLVRPVMVGGTGTPRCLIRLRILTTARCWTTPSLTRRT